MNKYLPFVILLYFSSSAFLRQNLSADIVGHSDAGIYHPKSSEPVVIYAAPVAVFLSGTESPYYLTSETVVKYTADAEKGDGKSAFQLYYYYLNSARDGERSDFFLKKAAELGYGKAEYGLGLTFLNRQPPQYQDAFYWLERAAQHGDEKVRAMVKERVSSIEKVNRSGFSGPAEEKLLVATFEKIDSLYKKWKLDEYNYIKSHAPELVKEYEEIFIPYYEATAKVRHSAFYTELKYVPNLIVWGGNAYSWTIQGFTDNNNEEIISVTKYNPDFKVLIDEYNKAKEVFLASNLEGQIWNKFGAGIPDSDYDKIDYYKIGRTATLRILEVYNNMEKSMKFVPPFPWDNYTSEPATAKHSTVDTSVLKKDETQ